MNDRSSLKLVDKEKANILQNQFCSVFTKTPDGPIPILEKRTDSVLSNVRITEGMVKKKILKLNVNKSTGPDEIHPQLLKELVEYVSEPIAFIFNKSMEGGSLPNDWKRAYVSPIFKKGNRNVAENYRPINLRSIVCLSLKN